MAVPVTFFGMTSDAQSACPVQQDIVEDLTVHSTSRCASVMDIMTSTINFTFRRWFPKRDHAVTWRKTVVIAEAQALKSRVEQASFHV